MEKLSSAKKVWKINVINLPIDHFIPWVKPSFVLITFWISVPFTI